MSKYANKFRRAKNTKEWQRHAALLELGAERAKPWRAHPALKLVVIRTALDGRELRVMFQHPADRTRFLREQRSVLKEVHDSPENRKALDRVWSDDEKL